MPKGALTPIKKLAGMNSCFKYLLTGGISPLYMDTCSLQWKIMVQTEGTRFGGEAMPEGGSIMAENPAADEGRICWEYQTLSRKTEAYLIDDLNAAGAEGWELVNIEYWRESGGMGDRMCWTAFLKRAYTGKRQGQLKQQQVEADEVKRKQKFVAAALDDSETEFTLQDEAKSGPQPHDDPPTVQSRQATPQTDDADELTLEGDDTKGRVRGQSTARNPRTKPTADSTKAAEASRDVAVDRGHAKKPPTQNRKKTFFCVRCGVETVLREEKGECVEICPSCQHRF